MADCRHFMCGTILCIPVPAHSASDQQCPDWGDNCFCAFWWSIVVFLFPCSEQACSTSRNRQALNKNVAQQIPAREDELRSPVERLFPANEFVVKYEVPFGLKRIDLVFKSRSDEQDIIAVELKLRNWKRAIWQAVHNRQIASYSYIALPEATAFPVDRVMLNTFGLGLIVTDMKKARILIPAQRSKYINERLAKEVSSIVESYSHV